MPLIDFPELRRRFSIRDVLRLLGYKRWAEGGEKLSGPCPLRCSPKPRICTIWFDSNSWHCNRCQHGGNHLDLYAIAVNQPLYEAAVDLCWRLSIKVPWLPTPRSGTDQRRGHPSS
jgi:hypothetical protein